MRLPILAALALALLAAACAKPGATASNAAPGAASASGAATPITAAQMPRRKPGLWRETVSMTGMPTGMSSQLCIDAASEANSPAFGQSASAAAHCAPTTFTRNPDGSIAFAASCDMGPEGKAATTGLITGDFNASYTATVETQITGSSVPSMNATRKMTIAANWTGPCAPGQKGGDIVLPNGQTRNILGAQGGAPGAGGQ